MNIEITTAIIAATAALSGVFISQSITLLRSFSDKKYQRQIMLRGKYEEMNVLVLESLGYYTSVCNCLEHEQILSLTSSTQSQRALVLARLYFPSLEQVLTSYILGEVAFYNTIVSGFTEDPTINAGAQARVRTPAEFIEIQANLFRNKDALLDALKKNASKYANV